MTRDPFLRLALIALVAAFVLALLLAARAFGSWVAVAMLAGGVVGAAALSIEDDGDARDTAAQLLDRARHARRFRVGPRE